MPALTVSTFSRQELPGKMDLCHRPGRFNYHPAANVTGADANYTFTWNISTPTAWNQLLDRIWFAMHIRRINRVDSDPMHLTYGLIDHVIHIGMQTATKHSVIHKASCFVTKLHVDHETIGTVVNTDKTGTDAP